MPGPLHGVRVVELAGLGSAPFCGMVLADLGADVVRIDRPSGGASFATSPEHDLTNRGKRSLILDLKREEGVGLVLDLVERAHVLIEGFRPGVTERIGIGPAPCLARNQALVYGRMTGWGQKGPMASMAGHDIDYIALSGVLHAVGPAERPIPPLNLVADFGGGGMLLALGVVAALFSARASGEGQVVDAAMIDGSALLAVSHHGYMADGWWTTDRESNLLDGGAPFYTTYQTADGGHMAVGALEPQFFAELLERLGISDEEFPSQHDRQAWTAMRSAFGGRFKMKTRDEWTRHFAGSDACVTPVLSMSEAPRHPHNVKRSTFVEVDGVTQPGPAPRFTGTPASIARGPSLPGAHSDEVLADLGLSSEHIGMLRESGVVS